MRDRSPAGSPRLLRLGALARRTAPQALALGALALVAQLPFFDRWFSHVDEGHMLLYADLVAKGGDLYRDATLYPLPGAFYLLAGVFELFGTSVRVARWVVTIEFAIFAAILFAVLRRALTPQVAALSVIAILLYRIWAFPHWHMYSYSTTALCLLAASLLAFLVGLDARHRRWLVASGLLAGLGIACKQDYGAAVLLALNGVLLAEGVRTRSEQPRLLPGLLALNGSAAVVGLVLLGHLAGEGLLREALRQAVRGHLHGIAQFEYPSLPPLRPLLEQTPVLRDREAVFVYAPALVSTVALEPLRSAGWYRDTIAWDLALKAFYYAPFVVAAAGGLLLAGWRPAGLSRRAARARWAVWAHAAAFAALLALNRPQDYVHFAVLYWPFVGVGLIGVDNLVRRGGRLGSTSLCVAAAALAVVAAPSLELFWRLRTQHPTPLELPRAGISVKPHEAETLAAVVDYVQQRVPPGRAVAAMPYFPIALFLSDRLGPHRSSYIVWPVPDHPERDRQIARALEEQDVDTIVWNFTQVVNFPPVERYAPELFRYVVDHYAIDRVLPQPEWWGYTLVGLRRESGSAPGTRLFPAPGDAARLWIETRHGERWPARPPEWPSLLRLAPWPFRPALALRPTANGARTVLARPLDVPPGARLETAIATHPRRWSAYPPSWVRFEVAVRLDGRREVLFTRTLDPNREPEDRGWFDVRVPLEKFAGRRVLLELATACERQSAERMDTAAWEVPRLVSRSTDGAPEAPARAAESSSPAS